MLRLTIILIALILFSELAAQVVTTVDPKTLPKAELKKNPRDCGQVKIDSVLAISTPGSNSEYVDCNLTLRSTDKVTKTLIVEGSSASGIVINLNGATIDGTGTDRAGKDMIIVRSRSYLEKGIRKWERPENITIKNANIIGSVRIIGMASNGEGSPYDDNGVQVNHFKVSSRKSNHVTTARNNAPTKIILDNLTITGVGRNLVYFAPGVTFSKLINSELKGRSDHVSVYLDAESYGNTIKNNSIYAATGGHPTEIWDRPQINIDASSHNIIIDNSFSSLQNGGIYLYRNCGDQGVIRHTTPSHNQIINNVFYYKTYSGDNPSVYIGARDRSNSSLSNLNPWNFCSDDDGYNFGSSASNSDFARYNVVMGNQIHVRSVSDMIKTKNTDVNSPNHIAHNTTVTEATLEKRLAGCYVRDGYPSNFIRDGKSIDLFKSSNDEPVFNGYTATCHDGEITKTVAPNNKPISKLNFESHATSSNTGSDKQIACPAGQKIIGIKAAANLENAEVPDSELQLVPMNTLKIVTESDNVYEGRGFINSTSIRSGSINVFLTVYQYEKIKIGCKEHDKNGGDCQIKVILYCR